MAIKLGSRSGDVIVGSDESDVIIAGGGNDIIYGGGGNDLVLGGSGFDIAVYLGDYAPENFTELEFLNYNYADVSQTNEDGADINSGVEAYIFGLDAAEENEISGILAAFSAATQNAMNMSSVELLQSINGVLQSQGLSYTVGLAEGSLPENNLFQLEADETSVDTLVYVYGNFDETPGYDPNSGIDKLYWSIEDTNSDGVFSVGDQLVRGSFYPINTEGQYLTEAYVQEELRFEIEQIDFVGNSLLLANIAGHTLEIRGDAFESGAKKDSFIIREEGPGDFPVLLNDFIEDNGFGSGDHIYYGAPPTNGSEPITELQNYDYSDSGDPSMIEDSSWLEIDFFI